MPTTVLLDNIAHKDLRVKTRHSAEFGDDANSVLVFPTEFVYVQREYPILFRKDSSGQLQAVALLGFDKNENLFLSEDGWKSRYIPAVRQRGPFLIGFQKTSVDGEAVREPVVHIDLDDPRVNRTEGEPIFLRHGGRSPYLDRVTRMLEIIYKGTATATPMFAALEEAGLIESMELDIQLNDRIQYKLPGFFTINTERLAQLDGTQLERLHKPGYLQWAMFVVSSLGNIAWLVELKNRKRMAAELANKS